MDPKHWNKEKQRAISTGKNKYVGALELNSFLNQYEETIKRLIRELRLQKINPSFEEITEYVKNFFNINRGDFFQKFDEFVFTKKSLSYSSKSKYNKLKGRLAQFQNEKNIKLTFENINEKFFVKYFNFLIEDQSLQNNAAMKELKYFRSFCNYLNEKKLLTDLSYQNFKIKEEQIEVVSLSKDELKQLKEFDFSENTRLERVRDLFYFQCLTGVRFSDLMNLKNANIQNGIWHLTTKKTKTIIEIPLLQDAKNILLKYKKSENPEDKALPQITNQKFNSYIKEAAKKIGLNASLETVRFQGSKRINKIIKKFDLISSHMARRTFITLMLELGMRRETVMAIVGISEFSTLKKYTEITKQSKKNELTNVYDKLFK